MATPANPVTIFGSATEQQPDAATTTAPDDTALSWESEAQIQASLERIYALQTKVRLPSTASDYLFPLSILPTKKTPLINSDPDSQPPHPPP